MPQYKVNIARKPTSPSTSTTIAAKTVAEAIQKVQVTSYSRDHIILSAEPISFKVNMAKKPTTIERSIMLSAPSPQSAVQYAEKQNPLFVVTGVLEIKH